MTQWKIRKVYQIATATELVDSRLWGTPWHGPKVHGREQLSLLRNHMGPGQSSNPSFHCPVFQKLMSQQGENTECEARISTLNGPTLHVTWGQMAFQLNICLNWQEQLLLYLMEHLKLFDATCFCVLCCFGLFDWHSPACVSSSLHHPEPTWKSSDSHH